uniref:Putative structural protein n=1 Tax=viral metagenome TaxID=1070528 RepID=A0A6M3JSB4_9ZZZZ
MSTPKRFTNGVTNVASDKPMGQLLIPDPTSVHTFFEDFDRYAAGDWTVTETDAGATQALADGDGGQLLITNTAADDDLVGIQLAKESFTLESGKKAWFTARIKGSDATQMDWLVGLHVTDTSPIASAPSDGVYFRKDDGDTNIDIAVVASSATVAEVNGIATATTGFVRLDIYFDGVDTIHYFVDGVEIGTIETTSFPTTELNVSFAVQNGEAVAKTLTVDWIGAVKER